MQKKETRESQNNMYQCYQNITDRYVIKQYPIDYLLDT